jgi:uncharacterized protein YggE
MQKMMFIPGLLLAVCTVCVAQPLPDRSALSIIRVTGEAVTVAQPDEARIQIGVTTEASTAQAAASQNAEKTEKIISALRKIVGSAGTVKTASYALNPNYRYSQNEKPELIGYVATNMVLVVASDLGSVGKLIDAAVSAGANNVQGLQFTLKDGTAAQTSALQQATKNAREKANALAQSLGVKVRRILSVEENGTSMPQPFTFRGGRAAETATTPVEPGGLDIQATVVMTVEMGE